MVGHNQTNNNCGMYHYHNFSPCLNQRFLGVHGQQDDSFWNKCTYNPIEQTLKGYVEELDTKDDDG